LVEPFQLSQPAISKHLKVLENAGLISRSRVAQSRPCHLEVQPLKVVADWVEHYRHFWTGTDADKLSAPDMYEGGFVV
jgi:DNA-binding transcriptional ArsR family regulator